VAWLLFGLLVLVGGVYVTGYLLTSDRVPRDTTVAGVDIGGLRPAAARTALSQELTEERYAPITVRARGASTTLDPRVVGLDIDVAASVEQTGPGRSWHPARIWDAIVGGEDYDPVLLVDEQALRAAVDGFAEEADRPARNGAVTFDEDGVDVRPASTGEVIDREKAVRRLQEAYPETAEVRLPVRRVQPTITDAEVSAAMDEFANPALSGPVSLVVGEQQAVLRPEDFGPALRLEPERGVLVPRLDEDALVRRLDQRLEDKPLAAKDATVRIVGGHTDGRPEVIPGKKGVTFDRQEVLDGFLDVVVQGDAGRTLRVSAETTEPDFTTEEAEALGIVEKVSEFTTYFPHSDYRNTNLGRAAQLINNTVLKPGDVFSLNKIVGERTAENGFVKGFIIADGIYKEDFGGGVSQVATTTFNAMFFAGLEDIEHKPHSFYISRYPIGREATVAWPHVDLRFRNDTDYGVLVEAWIDPSTPSSQGAMHVRMWSTKVWRIKAGQSAQYNFTDEETRTIDAEGCVPNQGYDGFEIDVYRYFYRPGSDKLHHRETFHTVYTPSDTVICV
jgi:vancomycin resistance protein YoaR